MFVLPGPDQLWISAQEDIRNFPAVELGWAGVDGRGEKSVLKAVGQGGSLVGKRPGNQPHDGVGEQCCGNFPSADDIVSDRYFAGYEMFPDTVVDAFVVSAQEDYVALEGKLVGDALVEKLAVG